MKIRTGFVSNSSTSSFLISYNPNDFDVCPHCGRSDSDPVKMIESASRSYVRWDVDKENIAEWRVDKKEDKERIKKDLEHAQELVVAGVHYMETGRYGNYRAEHAVEDYTEQLEKHTELTELVEDKIAMGKTVASIEIEEHDEYVMETFRRLVDNKQVEVLEEGNY